MAGYGSIADAAYGREGDKPEPEQPKVDQAIAGLMVAPGRVTRPTSGSGRRRYSDDHGPRV
jgi:hypothetical protein